jgi:hypothetical protein
MRRTRSSKPLSTVALRQCIVTTTLVTIQRGIAMKEATKRFNLYDIDSNKVGDEKIEVPELGGCDEEERTVLTAACDLEMKDPRVCSECGENLCVFEQNELRLMSYDEDEHFHLEEADIPTNNIRMKKLYRQLTLILNGGPMGVGIRRPLPTCCVRKIREMFPSEEFMGFRWE